MDDIAKLLNEVAEYPLELRLAVALHEGGEDAESFWRRCSAGEFNHVPQPIVLEVQNHLRDVCRGKPIDSTLRALARQLIL